MSRMSLLVPVFTALKKRVARTLSKPKVRVRALLSARIFVTIKLACGLKMRFSRAADACAGEVSGVVPVDQGSPLRARAMLAPRPRMSPGDRFANR